VIGAKKQGASQNVDGESVSAGGTQLVPVEAGSTCRPGFAGQSHQNREVDISETTIRIINLVKILEPHWEGNQLALQRFEAFATSSHAAHIRALNILPSLSQFNFIKALFANIEVFGLSDEEMDDEALSPFNKLLGPFPIQPEIAKARFDNLPTSLRPTELQHATPHHPWIDLLPMPAMRDNILRQDVNSFDEEELCHAMRGQAPEHNAGLLVWRDPWDPTGWEVTEEFIKSWGWVVVGCMDLIHSTNTWRARRGEKPLFRS
jgi:hypothetical protein